MLVKKSLHLVLHRVVLACPVWQDDKCEEIEMSRGEGGSGWAAGAGLCLSFPVRAAGGRLEESPCMGGDARSTSGSSASGLWILVPCLL